jgi:hypothetical protein
MLTPTPDPRNYYLAQAPDGTFYRMDVGKSIPSDFLVLAEPPLEEKYWAYPRYYSDQPLFGSGQTPYAQGRSKTRTLLDVMYHNCKTKPGYRALMLGGEPHSYQVVVFSNKSTFTVTRDPDLPYKRVVYDYPLSYRWKS